MLWPVPTSCPLNPFHPQLLTLEPFCYFCGLKIIKIIVIFQAKQFQKISKWRLNRDQCLHVFWILCHIFITPVILISALCTRGCFSDKFMGPLVNKGSIMKKESNWFFYGLVATKWLYTSAYPSVRRLVGKKNVYFHSTNYKLWPFHIR